MFDWFLGVQTFLHFGFTTILIHIPRLKVGYFEKVLARFFHVLQAPMLEDASRFGMLFMSLALA